MGEYFKSITLIVAGTFKRAYIWLPALLLDPFDLYNNYIKPNLPPKYQSDLNMPSDLGLFAFITLIIWAGVMTFHNLRINNKHKIESLERKTDELQNELNNRKPEFSLGKNLVAFTNEIKLDDLGGKKPIEFSGISGKIRGVKIHLCFFNSGALPAYNLHFDAGFLPGDNPENFIKLSTLDTPNRISPGIESDICRDLEFYPFKKDINGQAVPITRSLIYAKLKYSGSQEGGRSYEEEWFLATTLGQKELSSASIDEKNSLLPYIKKAYEDNNDLLSQEVAES